eukprot:scaffold68570_cov67-Attheya_sp.AAC.1
MDIAAVDPSLTQLRNALRAPIAMGAINSLISWLSTDGNGVLAPDEYEPLIFSGEWPNEDTRGEHFGQRDGVSTLNCFVSKYAGQQWVEKTRASSSDLRFIGLSLSAMSVLGYAFQQRFYELSCSSYR